MICKRIYLLFNSTTMLNKIEGKSLYNGNFMNRSSLNKWKVKLSCRGTLEKVLLRRPLAMYKIGSYQYAGVA